MEIKHPQYFGQVLLKKGFRVWFKYMFYVIEGIKFVEEDLHTALFDQFDRIYEHTDTRTNINIPPRAGKTTMAKYFLAYCWAKNAKSNFIYTSFSQDLLGDIARSFATILEHPIYKAMYDLSVQYEDIEESPVNNFWARYLEQQEGKKTAVYTSRKVVSPLGGVILFASIGSSITGFGAGVRAASGFTGALIIDDGNKPADINSKTMRDKVIKYYEETLLSRLNNPDTPIFNIQQRLHVDDLAGALIKKYNFKTLARALVVDDVCQLPSQYTEKRLKEIQVNDYMFQAQYQQQPYLRTGSIFKVNYWKYYRALPVMQWRGIYGDTAQKIQEQNDYSVFECWGKSLDGQAHLIDLIRGKWEAPELLIEARAFWNKHNKDKSSPLRHMKIEDKVSGTGLIQTLSREGIPVLGIPRNRDKFMRANDVVSLIESGNVFLPENASYLSEFLSEASQFTGDGKTHDDQIDPMMDALTDILQGNIINYEDII
jgi:predicted phage terminase large subunit-like protein